MSKISKIKRCRICYNQKLIKIIDLKDQYIQSSFIKKNSPKPYKKKIPLQLVLCKKCSLVQLLHTVDKNILYKNYWYESGINSTMRLHLKTLAHEAIKLTNNQKKININILDIGCNDGTLLNCFPKNIERYGIDPSQIIRKIKNNKIKIIQDFFPPRRNQALKNKKFDLILSIAMFYDLDDPNIFVKNIKSKLKKNGVWIFELSYLIDMLKLNSFDTICFEHLEYYSLNCLNFLMKKHNLKIFKISKNSINGGSIRCFVTHKDNFIYDKKTNYNYCSRLLINEKRLKVRNKYIYDKFALSINIIKKRLLYIINNILKNKETIYVLGASTKGNTILQFLEIDNKSIPYAIDRNKEKIGAKTLGTNIKIISENKASNKEPNYKLVLPWHFKTEIIKRELNYLKKGGKLIFPLPSVTIISEKNYRKHVKKN
tara:strand:- start:233 stop:1516 length:1284 start_codon:yes stop_codon:yes gene_type:complete